MGISDLWYRNAIVYAVDLALFLDSDGDGVGDFRGLTARLDHIERLGVTCLWLLPFYPSPNRDNGYDVTDYYGVDPRYGTLGDFVDFLHDARERGIHVLLDLVVNHTSDQHPWFQAARRDPDSKYRDYYIWADDPPAHADQKPVFPDVEQSVWTYDDVAGAYYFHHFYHFQPDLNLANAEVREEIRRIMGFWLELGVSGFRVDAAPFLIRHKGPVAPADAPAHWILRDMHRFARRRRAGAVLLAETNVTFDRIDEYFGGGDEMQMLFSFAVASHAFLALATESAEPIVKVLHERPAPPDTGQWLTFLRNLDELDLEHLSEQSRETVFRRFAPDEDMRIFGRGIRRRLAPMLDGDPRRIRQALSLLLSLPGTPLLTYGDEIGMGDDLALEGRESVRTPMQWSDEEHGGFSEAPAGELASPVISDGPFSYRRVNVAEQRLRPDSLLNWTVRAIATRRDCPELGFGAWRVLDGGDPAVLALRHEWERGVVITVHNLCGRPCRVRLRSPVDEDKPLVVLLSESDEAKTESDWELDLPGHGYRWLRVGGVLHRRRGRPGGSAVRER